MWFQLSATVQYVILFTLGLFVGGQVNRGIYRLAWFARDIGPWSAPATNAPQRHWFDFIPVLGWLGLRREASIHGAGYWVRPMLIELSMGFGFVALYWWEMQKGLLPVLARGPGLYFPDEMILAQFLVHALLISLMAVATFIDFDEKTIPDSITVPGVLLLLTLAALLPNSALPVLERFPVQGVRPLQLTSPLPWPDWLDGPRGLIVGMASFCGWCLALVPRTWTTRRGLRNAVRYLVASIFRTPAWKWLTALALVGCVAIGGVWLIGGLNWRSLLTALVGMAFGGGMIWTVRIVGTAVLDKEAMGFGDVTLMAMIGSYVGWQASLVTFFLAPFAALVISLGQWMFTRRRDIAFGPYLCAAAVMVIVRWDMVWHGWAAIIFGMGWYVPGMMLICVAAMAILLMLWRFIEERIFSRSA